MSLPIITLIKDRFENIVSRITDIEQVYMYPIIPINIETALFPFTAIYDIPEDWMSRNRLEVNIITMHLETYYKVDSGKNDLSRYGDMLEALIHDAIIFDLQNGSLKTLIEKLEKKPPKRSYVDEEQIAVVVQDYGITYLQTYGDSFSKQNY